MWNKFPFVYQKDQMDCGPACLQMVSEYHGKSTQLEYLRKQSYITREGVSLKGLIHAAEKIGFRTIPVKLGMESLNVDRPGLQDAPLPCIVHWEQNHFVVVHKISDRFVWIADPKDGLIKLPRHSFMKSWCKNEEEGIALLLEPSLYFSQEEEAPVENNGFKFLFAYLRPNQSLFFQLGIGLLVLSIFQFLMPFLAQAIVDIGIVNQDFDFIGIILLSQFVILIGEISASIVQSWILLYISTRVNVSLLADFLEKLLKLGMDFFDSKIIGDLMQRIGDHERVERFVTSTTLSMIFSFTSFFVFLGILYFFHQGICAIFLFSVAIYIVWVMFFQEKRKANDYQRFRNQSDHQSTLIELIQGVQEIKLQNSEARRLRKWMGIQARLFRINTKYLRIAQFQDLGAITINRVKDILIIYISAKAVIQGEMTLGMMLAIQYIVGRMNVPLNQFVEFIRLWQDAKISIERMSEIHRGEVEISSDVIRRRNIPSQGDLVLHRVSFAYNPLTKPTLDQLSLCIPRGKHTAIVGLSGSGKTTLIKLLMGFYQPVSGEIQLGGVNLADVDIRYWRDKCGAVMQDGYIFSDTIANNITESEAHAVDDERLLRAVEMANLMEFVSSLPQKFNTIIGPRGVGISQGQKQRLLIARVIYKNPDFLFFDEATNALDAENERDIVQHVERLFAGKTMITVAHRLSTVKKADQIVFLDQGQIREVGTHQELLAKGGGYYQLVKNQLEING